MDTDLPAWLPKGCKEVEAVLGTWHTPLVRHLFLLALDVHPHFAGRHLLHGKADLRLVLYCREASHPAHPVQEDTALCAEEESARQQQVFRSHYRHTAQAQPLVTAAATSTQDLEEHRGTRFEQRCLRMQYFWFIRGFARQPPIVCHCPCTAGTAAVAPLEM